MHFQEALSKHEFYELCRQKSYDIACTYKNIVFIRHVITFTLHTNLFIPRKRKSIAVNNRSLTDSSVVSEKLKVKEEIKILEDYYVMTWNNRGWTQDEVIWLHLKGVTFHFWPGTCPFQAPQWEERIRKAKNGGDETAKIGEGSEPSEGPFPLPRLPLFSLRSLTFFSSLARSFRPSQIFFFFSPFSPFAEPGPRLFQDNFTFLWNCPPSYPSPKPTFCPK